MLAISIGFLIAFALILLQVPIATALGLVGFGGVLVLNGWTPAISMVATITRDSTLVYTLIVLPLFVLMGNLVAGAGISGSNATYHAPRKYPIAGCFFLRLLDKELYALML